jgi:hypothetical protein
MSSAAGVELMNHRIELELVLAKIMSDHTARCTKEGNPCQWAPGALDAILCDLEWLLERYHQRRKAA